ncbi:MAG: rod shape-determining protein RodA [Actinomycetota bacterium]|nr:rod shape-determining protein RodA [Actinomycetota bacterium]
MVSRRWNRAPRVDWILLVATLVLVTIGALSVYAATRNQFLAQGRSGTTYLKRDLINLVVGATLASPAAFIDYRQLRTLAPAMYGGLCFLLVLVLSPVGATINGAHAWFALGPVQLEPSEFMKVALILFLAGVLSERRDREPDPHVRDVLFALVAAGIPVLLILAEPALGIAIVVGAIALTVLALSGAPAKWVGGLLAATVLVAVAVASLHLLKPYQEQRFTYFTDPHGNGSSTGYQIEQSRIAIGSGELTGQGFLKGSQTDGGFIPEQQTDFVFTVAAEESGLAGATVILLALGVLLWRGITIASRAPDLYGSIVAGSVVMWLAFQSFTNIGMTVGIMPVTGLPLPFVSYGGSSLFADLIGVALLSNIARRSGPSSAL